MTVPLELAVDCVHSRIPVWISYQILGISGRNSLEWSKGSPWHCTEQGNSKMFRLPESVIYKALLETSSDHKLTKLFQTPVEVLKFCTLAQTDVHQPTLLSLHNIAFIHGMLCRDLFAKPNQWQGVKCLADTFTLSHHMLPFSTEQSHYAQWLPNVKKGCSNRQRW